MKRTFFVTLIFLLIVAPLASANSWEWWGWGNSQPSLNEPGWQSPNPWPPNPAPNPDPKPPVTNPDPILPSRPSNPGGSTPSPNPNLSADERNLIELVNQERVKNGRKPLEIDYSLVSLAKEKSHDMAVNNYFSHSSPTLGTVYTMLDRAGIYYERAGENIARTGSFARIHPLFMGSSGHKANILHAGYTHIGVGIVKWGTSYYVTQIFTKK